MRQNRDPRRRGRAVSGRTDPRVVRTARAFERAVVELAGRRPISRITVAELAAHAGATRATFYNRYSTPLDLLLQVLQDDLDRGHRREELLLAGPSAPGLLRVATTEVAAHVERFAAVYRQSLSDPADRGVHDALVRHFAEYTLAVLSHAAPPGLTPVRRRLAARFLSHGFAGVIQAWLGEESATTEDLVEAAIACAPPWWPAT